MARTLYVTICKDTSWEIATGLDNYDRNGKTAFSCESGFDEQGRLGLLSAPLCVLDSDFKKCSKEKAFQEHCHFVHLARADDKTSIIKEFDGTFIDAMHYVAERI